MTTTLEDIQELTRVYADACDRLNTHMNALEEEIKKLQRRRLSVIKRALSSAQEARGLLQSALDDHPALFATPRTHVFHGVKVGYQKGKGKLIVSNEGKTVELIKKKLEDQAELLIQITEKPVKKALQNLPASDLKKIGARIDETGDSVVIKHTVSDLEKMITTFLKGDGLKNMEGVA